MSKKIYKIVSYIILMACSFILFSVSSKALTYVYITGTSVMFREGAGVGFRSMASLNDGDKLLLLKSEKVGGAGCDAGWYNVNYNNQNGFVCSDYITFAVEDNDDYRPWTSPKKAIFGGAKFISYDYIAEGQNTSYLKKFNVNPNSGYALYSHQYMANLAAPCSEAYNSYISYRDNGLLKLPLTFSIPIFKNMPEATKHPTDSVPKKNTTPVTDQEFEKKLNAEGFPESYKTWIRELHKSYPNWTFKGMQTNIDFKKAVEEERWINSINACSSCYDSPLKQTEPGWYIANTATIEYYLDPRNFLDLDSILMFEDLSYNKIQTASVVQSVLNNTFMSGKDSVDKLSYADIFVEAGKTHNINPVYLASLAKQEMGVNMGTASSGKRFTYKGSTYEGFYNFFNIGAYSSEENPVLAGLVYAARGASKDASGVYKGSISSEPVNSNQNNNNNNSSSTPNKNDNTNNVTPTATYLSKMNMNRKSNFVTNISLNTNVSSLKKIVGNDVTFKNSSGGLLGDSELLTTGSTLTFKNGEVLTVVIYGDLTGDGKINSADLLKMRQALLKKVTLQGAYQEAAHVNTISGSINSSDLLRLRQHLLGKKNINQA